jgi:F-type H+-transporting ATPase subunit epsilon
MQVELVAPDSVLYSGEATMVIVRTETGEEAFLANHSPFLASLADHETRIFLADGSVARVLVHGGFAGREQQGLILSDAAELVWGARRVGVARSSPRHRRHR